MPGLGVSWSVVGPVYGGRSLDGSVLFGLERGSSLPLLPPVQVEDRRLSVSWVGDQAALLGFSRDLYLSPKRWVSKQKERTLI